MKSLYLSFAMIFLFLSLSAQEQVSYLQNLRTELQKKWPDNRTVNLVFHGHSVPSGYANTPNVKTLQAYPHQVLEAVKEIYPYAVVNSITTSIGGENAEQLNLWPNEINGTDKFWFEFHTTVGKDYYFVDPERRLKEPLFDKGKLASGIAQITRGVVDRNKLELLVHVVLRLVRSAVL